MAPQIKCKTSNPLLNLIQTQQTLNIGFFGDLLQFSPRGLTSWKDLQYLPLQSPRFPPPHHQYAPPGSYFRVQSPPSSILPSPNAQLPQGPRKNSLCSCYDIVRLHKNSSQPCSFNNLFGFLSWPGVEMYRKNVWWYVIMLLSYPLSRTAVISLVQVSEVGLSWMMSGLSSSL